MKTSHKLIFRLDKRLCKGCRICVSLCPKDVLETDEYGMPVVRHAENCVLCKLCEYRCPDFAIRIGGDLDE